MSLRRGQIAFAAFAALTLAAHAATLPLPPKMQAGDVLGLFKLGTPDALAGSFRGYLLRSMPEPLYETAPGWGHTARVPAGLAWTGRHGEKNQGAWRRLRITALVPHDTLVLEVRNARLSEPGSLAFSVFLAMDARADYTKQKWEAGLKLYDASFRGRFRAKLVLDCEARARLEAGAVLLPEAVLDFRVTRADLKIENFVMEHAAGIGGDAAKLLGDAGKGILHELHPAFERDLLARADAAIVKAGHEREIRVSVLGLINGMAKAPSARP
jgi:hypothetical protein